MPPKKEEPKKDLLPEILLFLVVAWFIYYVLSKSDSAVAYYGLGGLEAFFVGIPAWFAAHFWPVVKVIAVFLSALAAVGIGYSFSRLLKINAEEHATLHAPIVPALLPTTITAAPKNDRWDQVVAHINSPNSSDWRLAIIEAEVILEELLKSLDYHGDGVGDMLKSVDKSDFLTLDNAWEAHKVRNRIAHDGSAFDLTERDAQRVVSQYESVFKEFKVI